MNNLYALTFFLMMTIAASAQQGIQYTQFMFSKLSFNPAYAGSQGSFCASCIHRSQWIGLEGAPLTQNINAHLPVYRNKIGLGLMLQRDKSGPSTSYRIGMAYAYRLVVGEGYLSFGINANIRYYQVDFSNEVAIESNDLSFLNNVNNKIVPNFGAGIYYKTNDYYVGLSAPGLIKSSLSLYNALPTNTDFAVEVPNYYMMGGIRIPLSEKMSLKPSAMLKYAPNAPFDMDANATLVFYDMFGVGASYRLGGLDGSLGESLDLLAHVQVTPTIRAGASYDFTLSEIRNYNSGSFEIFLSYCRGNDDEKITNPRYFF